MGEHDHYFSAAPVSADQRRRLPVRLVGRDVEVEVAPGVFSPGGLDKGTAVLLAEAPAPPPRGTFLDLGCGWGPVALSLALLSPLATVHAVDVNERALDLVRRNAATLGLDRPPRRPAQPRVGQPPGLDHRRPRDAVPPPRVAQGLPGPRGEGHLKLP